MGSGSCSPSRGTGGCCRGPTARGERNARRRRPKVRGNGRYDDGRLDGDEVYANAAQRRAHPGVDDDSLIQDTIESIEETCAVGYPFNWHRSSASEGEKPQVSATLVPDPVRSNIGPLNSMVAKHLPIQPLYAEHVMENIFCRKIHPR